MPSRPPVFRARPQPSRQEQAVYDQRRGTARERGYDARWDKASLDFRGANPLCLGCHAIGRVVVSQVTDHVEPHKGDMIKFWNAKRWQPACCWHHDVVKQQLERMYERGEITVDDLWLNSDVAVRLTLELMG